MRPFDKRFCGVVLGWGGDPGGAAYTCGRHMQAGACHMVLTAARPACKVMLGLMQLLRDDVIEQITEQDRQQRQQQQQHQQQAQVPGK